MYIRIYKFTLDRHSCCAFRTVQFGGWGWGWGGGSSLKSSKYQISDYDCNSRCAIIITKLE